MNVSYCNIHANIPYGAKRCHPHWEIYYRLSGRTTSTIGDRTYSISEGDIVVTPPNVFQTDVAEKVFSDLILQVDTLNFSEVQVLHDPSDKAYSLLQMIYQIFTEKNYNYASISNTLAEAFFQYLDSLSHTANSNPFVCKLKNVIIENIANADFNLTQELKSTGYHPEYVRRCFKAELGKAPLTYLTWLRIDRAKQLLRGTYESVETIASSCSFRDSFYFSTCFKKHTGVSPLQYRKQSLEE